MQKIVLALLLAVVSGSAMAEWVQVGESANQTYYVDPATSRQHSNAVKMWILFDFQEPKNLGSDAYLSLKVEDEFDCLNERRRTLYGSFYSGRMGHGDNFFTNSKASDWAPVTPEGVTRALWDFACKKTRR